MSEKPPHHVLGVERDAELEEIKRAFRELVKELHPDRNPGGDADRLRVVVAAYRALRKRHDESGERIPVSRGPTGRPGTGPGRPTPLYRAGRAVGRAGRRMRRAWDSLTSPPEGTREDPVDLVVSPREAARGRATIERRETCGRCRGEGREPAWRPGRVPPCRRCKGRGQVARRTAFPIPPGATTGTVARVRPGRGGAVWVRIRVREEDDA